MVIDTSVLLSVLFKETHAEWASNQLEQYKDESVMSTINLAETLIHLQHHCSHTFQKVKSQLLYHSSIRFIAPDIDHAVMAADARLRFPLNFGDCFAYALAKAEGCPILTLDKDFFKTDAVLITPYKR